MNDAKNITIAMLTLSAVVLSFLLVATIQTNSQAQASSSARFGDYIMSPGLKLDTGLDLVSDPGEAAHGDIHMQRRAPQGSDDLFVIDVLAKRLNVYYTDDNRGRLDILDSVDLPQYFQTTR